MEFGQNNHIVRLCLQGIASEIRLQEARAFFLRAWNEATNDFERFIAAHFVARHQPDSTDKLRWLETNLELALKVNDDRVKSAFPLLYSSIAKCYEELGDSEKSQENLELAARCADEPSDTGPFYHGTKANLQIGDSLTAGNESNYKAELIMNHVYFTAVANGAGLAAELANGVGRERVYVVEPTGRFENDPNVTNNLFPGNPTRSYRTRAPLKIVGEVTDWKRLTPDELLKWRERLANNKGEIVN